VRQYVLDVVTGNQPRGRVLRTLCLAGLRWFLRVLPVGYRVGKSFTDWVHRVSTGRPTPAISPKVPPGVPTPPGRVDLQPGEFVRVKSQAEIEETLDVRNSNRGLFFDCEMIPFCGKVFQVRHRVSRIIDEPTGRMLQMKQPCIVLDQVVCNSEY